VKRGFLWPVLPADGRLVCRQCHHRASVHRLKLLGRSLLAKCDRCPAVVCAWKTSAPALRDVEEGP
jgi:hypothetical protein